jgi:hypothetical protein
MTELLCVLVWHWYGIGMSLCMSFGEYVLGLAGHPVDVVDQGQHLLQLEPVARDL